jgi:DNA-binding transcriptional LysR family regulator
MDGPIDSRQMHAFVSLATGGCLKAAARELGITESAISHAVRNLEQSLDVRLFRRQGKGRVLTSSGALLLEEATAILTRMRDVRARLGDHNGAGRVEIRLAAATSFINCSLQGVVTAVREQYPDIQLTVTAGDRDECLRLLAKGEVDAAITVNVSSDSDHLRCTPLWRDCMLVLMAANHRLAALAAVPVHQLCRETVYLRPASNYTSQLVEHAIAAHGFRFKHVERVASFAAIGQIVRLGIGVTFQAQWAAGDSATDPQYAWRPLAGMEIARDWCFVVAAGRPASPAIEALAAVCQASTPAAAALAVGQLTGC